MVTSNKSLDKTRDTERERVCEVFNAKNADASVRVCVCRVSKNCLALIIKFRLPKQIAMGLKRFRAILRIRDRRVLPILSRRRNLSDYKDALNIY